MSATHSKQRSISAGGDAFNSRQGMSGSVHSGNRNDLDDLVVLFSGQQARITQFTVYNYNASRDFDVPPPDNSMRSPESLVSQGILKVYKILAKKAAFLQCGLKFVHPVLPKSRLWRTNVHEFLLPQPIPGKFWRIELIETNGNEAQEETVCAALDELETAFRTTCLYRNEYRPLPQLEPEPEPEPGANLDLPLSPPASRSSTPLANSPISASRSAESIAPEPSAGNQASQISVVGLGLKSSVKNSNPSISSAELQAENIPVTPRRNFTAPVGFIPPTSPSLANATIATTMAVAATPSPVLTTSYPSSATSTLDALLDTFGPEPSEGPADAQDLFDLDVSDGNESTPQSPDQRYQEHFGGQDTQGFDEHEAHHCDNDEIFEPSNTSIYTSNTEFTKDTEITSDSIGGDSDAASIVYHNAQSAPASPSTPYLCHPLIPLAQRNNIISSTYPLRFRPMDDDWLDVTYYGSPPSRSQSNGNMKGSPAGKNSYLTLASQITGDIFSSSHYFVDKLRAPSIFSLSQREQQSQAIDALWPIYNSMTISNQNSAYHSPGNSVDSTLSDLTADSSSTSSSGGWRLLSKVGQWISK